MWFPSLFQTLNFTRRGRALFALVLAISVGVLIGISQGPAPRAAAFDARSLDAGMLAPVAERTSIVGTAIPLPTQPPADVAAVSAEAVTKAPASPDVLPTETVVRTVDGLVVARADAFAPDPEQHVALRMASAFASVDSLGSPPVVERWPGFASLAGGGGGGLVAGADSPLLVSDTENAAATTSESEVAAADPKPVGGRELAGRGEAQTDAREKPSPEAAAAVQPVPEPSSVLLMVVAMLGLGMMVRGRKLQRF